MSNIVEYGVSQTLQAEFDMLRDTLSMREYEGKHNGELNKKYAAKTIDKLAQYIICRNYGKACLELAYLCWPIVRHQDYTKGLLHFFWIEEAISPSRFRNSIYPLTQHDHQTPSITLNAMGLVISSTTQDFTVSASRVMLLSALLELLVGNIANVLEDIETHLSTPDIKCVGELASYLQKKLYEFLKVHLPTANLQQKYRYIHHWVAKNRDREKLNDEAVLNFWTSAIDEDGYVKFENAFADIVDYQFADEQVKVAREIYYSRPDLADLTPQSFEFDEDEANWLYETVFESNENAIMPPTWLVDAPKFITKKEYACVSRLFELRSTITQFPLSLLRSDVFGQWQNLIIQQIRDKRDVLIDRPQQDYTVYLERLHDWRKQASNTILCCAAILYEEKDVRCLTALSQGVGLLVEHQESLEFGHMLKRLVSTSESNQDNYELTFPHISRWLLQSKTLNSFFSLAKKTLAKNNRIGFQNSEHYHEADIYEQGADHLVRGAQLIHDLTQAVSQQLANKNGETVSLDTFFTSDLFIFKSELVKRHGLKHE
nr:hypothetical protein [uncultured Glaciecola sp.]